MYHSSWYDTIFFGHDIFCHDFVTIFYSVMAAAGVVGALAASMGSSALASSVLSYFVMRIVMVRISPRLIFQEALAEPAAAQGAAINVSLVHNGELVRASVLWVLGVVGARCCGCLG